MGEMPYDVYFPDGMLVKVKTADEVMALRRAAGLTLQPQPVEPAPAQDGSAAMQNDASAHDSWAKFCKVIASPKYALDLKLLAVLKGVKQVSVPELMQALSIETDGGIGARIGHIGVACKIAGLAKVQIILSSGKGGQKRYQPGPLLRSNDLPPVPEP